MIRKIRYAVIGCAALVATGLAVTGGAWAEAAPCKPMAGWEAVAKASAGKFLIFGEAHGTTESPTAVREFVCAVASAGKPVLLAIEVNSRADVILQAAWRSTTTAPDELRRAVLETFGKVQSGNGSAAMMEMMLSLHELKRGGADIDVVAFNGAKDDAQKARFAHLPSQEPHESAQAENIHNAAGARDYAHVVVLVGNAHARKKPESIGDTIYESMAMKLAPPDRIISLRMGASGGAFWACRLRPEALSRKPPYSTADMDCRAYDVPASGNVGPPEMTLDADASGAYDGYYFVGETHASPPAQ